MSVVLASGGGSDLLGIVDIAQEERRVSLGLVSPGAGGLEHDRDVAAPHKSRIVKGLCLGRKKGIVPQLALDPGLYNDEIETVLDSELVIKPLVTDWKPIIFPLRQLMTYLIADIGHLPSDSLRILQSSFRGGVVEHILSKGTETSRGAGASTLDDLIDVDLSILTNLNPIYLSEPNRLIESILDFLIIQAKKTKLPPYYSVKENEHIETEDPKGYREINSERRALYKSFKTAYMGTPVVIKHQAGSRIPSPTGSGSHPGTTQVLPAGYCCVNVKMGNIDISFVNQVSSKYHNADADARCIAFDSLLQAPHKVLKGIHSDYAPLIANLL